MNKITTLFLMMWLASLAACGGGGTSSSVAATSNPATVTTSVTPTPTGSTTTGTENNGNTSGSTSGSGSGNTGGTTTSTDTSTNPNTGGATEAPLNPVFVADTGQNRSYPLTWLADGSLLLGANHDNVFKVWDGRYGVLRQAVAGHSDWIQAIAVSADSRLVATAGRDSRLHFWLNTEGTLGDFGASDTQLGVIRALSFSSAGSFIALAGSNGQLQVWNHAQRQVQTTWKAHDGIVYSVQYSPNGQMLASAGADGLIRLWNPLTGEKLADLGTHAGAVYQVLFSADGKQLVSAGGDGKVKRWDIASKRALGTVGEHDAAVYALALAADGVTLASGDANGFVGIWRLPAAEVRSLAAKPLGTVVKPFAVDGSGAVHSLAFDPLSGQLGVSSADAAIRVWDTASAQLQRTLATAGAEGPYIPVDPDPIDYSTNISSQLAGLVFDGMKPVLTIDTLLVQPDRLANAFLLGLNQTTLPCPEGTYQYTFLDTDADKRYASVRDDFAVNTQGCQESAGALALTGAYGLQLTASSQTATTQSTGTDVRLNGLVVDDEHYPVTLQGVLHVDVTEPLDGVSQVTTDINSSQFDLVIKDKGSYAFSSLQARLRADPVSEDRAMTYHAQLALQGLKNSLVSNGDYAVTTLESFKFTVFDAYPYAGKMQIQHLTRDNKGQITVMTVLNSQKVRVETDKDGDAVIDHTQEILWKNLSSPFQGS